ncbi:hypothetical protein [Candidatus Kuenenia stuttgartiensis]|uniref:hypothetical protein n=1 Tax=Kuenenia stuttgartiensis TaxID=174633 RepID=UPI00146DFFBB|nr:hypothetical protein [Candidatus Kuenenia stuttgartiensis]
MLELVQDIYQNVGNGTSEGNIYNINKIVSSDLMSDMLFRSISNELKRVMEFDRVSIALIDEKKQNVEVAAMDKSYDYTAISENDWLKKKGAC